jgi:hypothetical protein
MGDDHDCSPQSLLKIPEEFEKSIACINIQITRWLVSQDKRWLSDKGTGDGHTLPLSSGHVSHRFVGKLSQPDEVQCFHRTGPKVSRDGPSEEEWHDDIIGSGSSRAQEEVLEDKADGLIAKLSQIVV